MKIALTVDNLEGIIYMREGELPITKEHGLYPFLFKIMKMN